MAEELYTMMVDGKPVAYAYGEEWVAMGLYMDDIKFKTPEEAKAWWEKYCAGYDEPDMDSAEFWKNEYIKEHDLRMEEYEKSVPVVRCMFCKHYIKHDKKCALWNHGVFKNDYCSRGQKKEVEE